MGTEIKHKEYIIRYYATEETYENLGHATGKDEKDAIEAYLGRKENKNETRELTADECITIDFGDKNGCEQS